MASTALAAGVFGGCASRRAAAVTSAAIVSPGKPLDAAAFRAARRFAETRYGRIAYLERGAGEAALFLHGFPLNGFQWRDALAALSIYRRCVAPDLMGLGYTEVAEGQSVAPAAQVDMLLALLDQLSISTVDLVANDSGGAVAQLLGTPSASGRSCSPTATSRTTVRPRQSCQSSRWRGPEPTWTNGSLPGSRTKNLRAQRRVSAG
jgi:hypothetical protein